LSAVPFVGLPDDARVWVFASPRPLTAEQREALLTEVDAFLADWHAHGHPVVGAREWRYDRFLLVGADERATGVSGCSIDSLFRTLKRLEREMGIGLLDSSPVWYRGEDDAIEAVSRADFRERAGDGELGADTVVFDNTVRSMGQVRHGEWELPARSSWHARLLESS
jgi:hypothetical protein